MSRSTTWWAWRSWRFSRWISSGLTTLDIIQDALELIEKHRGVKLVIEELPLDDAATYQIFSQRLHQRRVPV